MRFAIALVALLIFASTCGAKLPDIVVFLSDDHGQLDSTPYGATDVRTPNMQRLADEGMVFSHAFIASPACAPSRAALLTGLMPARNGAEANHTYKRDDVGSLPTDLQVQGYYTVAIGKVAHNPRDAQRQGFDRIEPNVDFNLLESVLKNRDPARPLAIFFGSHEPHVPWLTAGDYDPSACTLPPTFVDTPSTHDFRARYYHDVTAADAHLGRVLELVDQHLPKQDTLVMYTSDHGAQWPFGKWNLYDAGIRVPLIVRWPDKIKPHVRSQAMVQWIDILPTLIEVAGGEIPSEIDGRSFLPILTGEKDAHRDVIFTTHSGDGGMNVYLIRSIRTRDWKLILNLHPEFAHTTHIDKALAEDGGRYWTSWFEQAQTDPAAAAIVKRYHERPEVELYDLRNDSFEQRNLAADPQYAEKVAAMRSQLEAWMEEQGDQRTVFNTPRLLSDPQSTQPGPDANSQRTRNQRRQQPQ